MQVSWASASDRDIFAHDIYTIQPLATARQCSAARIHTKYSTEIYFVFIKNV